MEKASRTLELEDLSSFLSSLDGIERIVFVDEEGFPVEFHGVGKEEAEAEAALAVDLAMVVSEHVGGKGEILVDLGDGKVIDVSKVKELLLLVRGERKPVEEGLAAIRKATGGNRLTCPHCQADLTIETYTCPSCSKTIPYTSTACPHCGADVRIKQCPRCGGLLNVATGKKIVKSKGSAIRLAAIEGALGGVITGTLTFAMANSPFAAGVAGLLGALAVGGILYLLSPGEMREVD